MQSPSHSWSDLTYLIVGALVGLIPQLISTYRNRKKSDLDNTETEARTEKTLAEARSLRMHDDLATGEGVGKMLDTLIQAGDKIRELQMNIVDMQRNEVDLALAQNDVRKMKALLDLYNISYSEADKPKK
jgi:hypothetical protein